MLKQPAARSPPSPMARATPAAAAPPSTLPSPEPTRALSSPNTRQLLTAEALAHVEAAATTAERARRLRAALGVRRHTSNARARVWADLLFGVLRFAVDDARLPAHKTLHLLALADELFQAAVAPSDAAGRRPALERVYAVLGDRVRGIGGVKADEADEAARWSVEEVAPVVAFLSSTFLRHLRAFQRVAGANAPARLSEAALTPLAVETPLPPPPLADAYSVSSA